MRQEREVDRITVDDHVSAPTALVGSREYAGTSEIPKLSSLLEMSKILSSALPFNVGMHQVLSILQRHHGAFRSAVALRRQSADELRIEEAVGLVKKYQRFHWHAAEEMSAHVVETGKAVLVPKVSREPMLINRAGRHRRSGNAEVTFMCVPILVNYTPVGALSIEMSSKKGRPYDRTLKFFGVVASMIGQAIKINQLIDADHWQLLAENVQLRGELRERYEFSNLIGNSGVIQRVYDQVAHAASNNETVLLRGEPGTGKALIAHTIHYNSARKNGPFIKFSCAALPAHVVEAELFGYERAASSAGRSQKNGRLQLAEGGTLFLDEIGDLNGALAQKLLHVLKEKQYERPGSTNTMKANARVIVATAKDLEEAVETGAFPETLCDFLNACAIFIPPLRERKADVTLLADHFLEKYASFHGKKISRISTTALDMLMSCSWPGNVRELEDSIEKAVLLCDGDAIQGHHLLPSVQAFDGTAKTGLSFKKAVETYEKDLIEETLKNTRGNRSKAATLLQTTDRILNYKIKKLSIDCDQFRG